MDAQIALVLLTDGIANGAIYVLIALGTVLIFSVTRVIFVPFGDIAALTALTVAALQLGRLPGTIWLVMVLAVAMACEHLAIGGGIIRLAFGILFGGIVLALSLAVGLGSKDLVSRSLEREAGRRPSQSTHEPVGHL